MKKIRLITVIAVMITLVFVACEDSESLPVKAITGTYVGTITNNNSPKSQDYLKTEDEAIAEITIIENNTIQVHLYDVELDTTFMMNYYEDMDSVNVCFTGDDFENMYGHMLGQGHVGGGMMGDLQNNETEWMHHLNDEHQEGDEHFGGFDMQNHTFSYQFTRMEDGLTHDLLFQGVKR
jgi:hypothetical protein